MLCVFLCLFLSAPLRSFHIHGLQMWRSVYVREELMSDGGIRLGLSTSVDDSMQTLQKRIDTDPLNCIHIPCSDSQLFNQAHLE